MMARSIAVPRDALLHRYDTSQDVYTDCFEVMHPGDEDLAAFISAFYTTWLFRLERMVLTLPLRRVVRDSEVEMLAAGQADDFAVWTVEDRTDTQILLADKSGATRSYLAVAAKEGGVTRLIFGSAVVPADGAALSKVVTALIPLHRFYSRALLRLAERKLRRG